MCHSSGGHGKSHQDGFHICTDLDQSRKRHQARRDARLGARLAALEEVLEAEGEDMSSDEGELAPPLPAILPTMKAIEELWVYIKALEERVLNLEVIVHAAVQAAPPQPSALLGA